MPLPRPRKREAASRKASQTPSPEPPAEAVSGSPTNSRNFSQRVNKKRSKERGSKPGGRHHGTSPELSDPDPQSSTPQILPEELEVTVQPSPRTQEQQRGKSETARPALEFLRTPFGGRLLVLDSFLYKQEKAMGDKVYWKCRQSVGLRCRGRAITRGTRATVMHGHCHPPDEEGLEARRRRQKLPIQNPGSQSSEGSGLHPGESETTAGGPASKYSAGEYKGFRGLALMSLPPKKRQMLGFGETRGLEFLRTCYGGSFLVHQSFLYKREKTVGDRVYWTCREHALQGCRSRAITQGRRVTVMRGHCHQPDEEALEARRQREKVASRLPARPVVDLLGRRGPGPLSFSRPRPRIQAKARDQPAEPSSSSSDEDEEEEEEDDDEDPRGPEFLKTPLGGSFLVFESFLYRREKAAGNKVYWTCRDQARMGCRSRAITQGRRVTVMRGHCHPPDLGGLEALRQRQKSPNEAQEEGSGDPEFLKTPFGGTFLVFESFLYRREKAAGDKVYWTCRDQARMGCRSRAITQGLRVMVMRRHCHPPDLGGLEELRDRDNFPRLAQTEDSETFQPLEFLRTSLGGSFLVFESFLYRKEKAIGDKVYWMCREQGRRGCRSRAITQGQQVTVMRAHCHPPDLRSLEALRQREKHPSPVPQDEAEMNLPPDDQLCYETGSSEDLHICGEDQDTVLDDTDDTAPEDLPGRDVFSNPLILLALLMCLEKILHSPQLRAQPPSEGSRAKCLQEPPCRQRSCTPCWRGLWETWCRPWGDTATQLFPSSDLALDLFVHHDFAASPMPWPWGVEEIAEHAWGGPSDPGRLFCHRSQEQAEPAPHPRPDSPWLIPSLHHFGSSLDVHRKLAEASRDQAPPSFI